MSCFFLTSTFSFMQTQNPTNSTNYFLSCKFHIYILNKTFCVPFNLLVPLAFSCCRALLLPAEGGQQQRIQRLHFPIITKHWSAADLQICFCSRPVHYKGLERSLWLPVIKSWCSVTCSFAWDGSNISDEAADSLHGFCFWVIIASIGWPAMTDGALGTVFTFVLLTCIKQGSFRFCVLTLVLCGICRLVWNAFGFSACQTASWCSYDFICLHPSGQYAISTSKCKWSCLLTFLAPNIIWCAWQGDRMLRSVVLRRWRWRWAKTSPYHVL